MRTLGFEYFDAIWSRYENKKARKIYILQAFNVFEQKLCGPDGTRTRDLRRDRAAF